MNLEFEEVPGEQKPVVLTPIDAPVFRGIKIQHLMFAVGVCALGAWGAVILGAWLVTGCSLLLLMAIIIGLIVVLMRRSSTRKQSLVWILTIAAERSLPFSGALLAFADQFGRSFRWRVQLLASFLNEGFSLPVALGRVPGAVSREAEVLIRTGYATGTLARSLREAANLPSSQRAAWGDTAARFFYLGWLLFVIQVISGFILYFIIPKFEAIFYDFGVSLPAITIFVIQASHFCIKYFYLIVPPVLLAGLVLAAGLMVLVLNSSAMWLDIPLLDGLLWRRHSALVMRALALVVGGQKPNLAAIDGLARDYPSGWVRRRLARVAEDIHLGRDWIEALQARGLIRVADAAVLESAQRVGNLEWALRELAESSDRRLGYRLQFWLQILFPLLVMGVGALVFLFAVAYFLPLVTLITKLAG